MFTGTRSPPLGNVWRFAVLVCMCVCACMSVCVKNVPTEGDKESRMGLTWSLMSSENLMKQLLLPGPSVFFLCSKGSRWRGLCLRPLLLSEVDPPGLLLFFSLRGKTCGKPRGRLEMVKECAIKG